MAVPSQYFERKRTLAMGLVATGAGLGGALQPIMLNKLFYSSLGFHNAVRISAAFNAVLLFAGVALMRTRNIPGKMATVNRSLVKDFKVYIKDTPYVCTVIGYVLPILSNILTTLRAKYHQDILHVFWFILSHILPPTQRYRKWCTKKLGLLRCKSFNLFTALLVLTSFA